MNSELKEAILPAISKLEEEISFLVNKIQALKIERANLDFQTPKNAWDLPPLKLQIDNDISKGEEFLKVLRQEVADKRELLAGREE